MSAVDLRPMVAERRFAAHKTARSTASRSSSVPCVMSTTSRMPARIAAGSSPFHVWSRTSTIAVPGEVRPTNSARPSASGSFTSGDSTRTSTGAYALISSSSAAVADCTQPTSSASSSSDSSDLLAERLRRPDGDDARFRHPLFTPMTLASGAPIVPGCR